MRTFLVIICLLLLRTPCAADERQSLRDENLRLKAELQLAKTGKLYLVVDLRASVILIKGGGTTIWRLPVSRSQIRGETPSPQVRLLAAKKSLFAPRRPVVRIVGSEEGKGPEADFASTVLELDDMPVNYRLLLDDGTSLIIEPEQVSWRGRLGLLWSQAWGWLRRTLHLLRPWSPAAERSEVVLTLAGPDAQRLYWSFDLTTPCLIRLPSGQS
jgi:hypothetical protein